MTRRARCAVRWAGSTSRCSASAPSSAPGIFSSVGQMAAGGPDHPAAGPALILSFVITAVACGFSRALLRRDRGAGAGVGQRLHLRLRRARRAAGLDHRVGPGDRVRGRQHLRRAELGRLLSLVPARQPRRRLSRPGWRRICRAPRSDPAIAAVAPQAGDALRPDRDRVQLAGGADRPAADRAAGGRRARQRALQRGDGDAEAGAGARRSSASAPPTSSRPTGGRSRPTDFAASGPARRWPSSRTSASTPSRPSPRRPATRSAICRAA